MRRFCSLTGNLKKPSRQGGDTLLSTILPAGLMTAEVVGEEPEPAFLFVEEASCVASAVAKRRREFANGRLCAHWALSRLGFEPTPLMPDYSGKPLWPLGAIGSITHCLGYCAAAVGASSRFKTLGIDAEVARPLPSGVTPLVLRPEEHQWVEGQAELPCGDRLIFSAKESVLKAWSSLGTRSLAFDEISVEIGREFGTFVARLPAGAFTYEWTGHCLVRDGLILTALAVLV